MSNGLMLMLIGLAMLGWITAFAVALLLLADRRRARSIAQFEARRFDDERSRRMEAEARARGVGGQAGAKPSIRRIQA